jgi:hypothetical protein
MADRKISDLTALTTPASGDYLPIVDISEVAAASKNKRITVEELMRGAPDGTAAAPSIAFESDSNTGIYSPGADQLAVSTGGTGRLFVDASGNIDLTWGVPRLAVIFDNDYRQGLAFNTTNRELKIFSTTNDSGGSIGFYTRNGAGASATDYGIERARIDSSGRLLVGTSTASSAGAYAQYGLIKIQGNSISSGGSAILNIARGEAATSITSGEDIGAISFTDSSGNEFGTIVCTADANAGAGDYPSRLVFSVTADGAASPTEALRISNDRSITVSDGGNVVLGTTTGTKIGTATTQKISLWNATPVVQPAAVANITTTATAGALPTPDGAVTIANTATPTVTELLEYCVELEDKLEDLLGKLRTVGIIAT